MKVPESLSKFGRKFGKFVGYPSFFLFCFLLFAYWTFPYDRAKEFIIQEVENPKGRGDVRAPSGYQLEIVDLAPSWFTGVEATGVNLTQVSDDPEAPPNQVNFEYIHARISLLSLMMGVQEISFEARVGGGNVEGVATIDGANRAIDMNFEGIRLRRVGMVREKVGLPVQGRATGRIVANLTEDRAATSGEIDVDIEGLVIGDGVAKLRLDMNAFTRAGLTVAETDFGDLELEMNMAEGTATVTKLQSRGEDIQLDGEGEVQVRGTLITSSVDAMLRIGISEAYRNANAGLFAAIENEPRVRAAKTDDDAYQFHVVGNIGPRMRWQGARSSPRPGSE